MAKASDLINTPGTSANVDGPSPTAGLGDNGTGNAEPIEGHKVVLTVPMGEVNPNRSE